MPDVKEVVNGLEMSYTYSNVDEDNTLVPQQLVLDALALLKAQESRVDGKSQDVISGFTLYCPNCGFANTIWGTISPRGNTIFCGECGMAVKWDEMP